LSKERINYHAPYAMMKFSLASLNSQKNNLSIITNATGASRDDELAL
jgi:hypothetical protein